MVRPTPGERLLDSDIEGEFIILVGLEGEDAMLPVYISPEEGHRDADIALILESYNLLESCEDLLKVIDSAAQGQIAPPIHIDSRVKKARDVVSRILIMEEV